MSGKINIAITGTGSLIGQAVIKSIRHSELQTRVELMGFDYFTDTVGSFWCGTNYKLPDILKYPELENEWLNFIILKIREHEVRLLFVGVDFELPLFAKHKRQIENETQVIVLVSDEKVIEIANDKYLTCQFLKENNLPYPVSVLPGGKEFSEIQYPVIVKPRKGARSIGVSKVNNVEQLQTSLEGIKDPVIQECVGKESDEFTCGTIFLNGNLKKMIALNRSLKAGNTYISHYRKDYPASITEYLQTVCNILKPFGACNFQLRLDKNGVPKIFEINSRHSGTTYIRSLFGYKEVEYIINYLVYGIDADFKMTEGTVVRYFDEFFIPLAQ